MPRSKEEFLTLHQILQFFETKKVGVVKFIFKAPLLLKMLHTIFISIIKNEYIPKKKLNMFNYQILDEQGTKGWIEIGILSDSISLSHA